MRASSASIAFASSGCTMVKVYGLERRLVTRVGSVFALSMSGSMPRLRRVGTPTS
jgi:hypothetical protein